MKILLGPSLLGLAIASAAAIAISSEPTAAYIIRVGRPLDFGLDLMTRVAMKIRFVGHFIARPFVAARLDRAWTGFGLQRCDRGHPSHRHYRQRLGTHVRGLSASASGICHPSMA